MTLRQQLTTAKVDLASRSSQLSAGEFKLQRLLRSKRKLSRGTRKYLLDVLATIHVKTSAELVAEKLREIYAPAMREMLNESSIFRRLARRPTVTVRVKRPARYST